MPLLPWFVIGAGTGLFTAWVERAVVGADGVSYDLSLVQRALVAGRAVWFYLGKLVWPTDLMFIYPRWDVSTAPLASAGWLLVTVVVTAALWAIRHRSRGPLAGWLFFVGTLFPALGFFNVFPFIYSFVADHFQYVAMLGIIVPVAGGAARIAAGTTPAQLTALRGLGALLLAVLALSANRQSQIYHDEETLYRATLVKNPACWMAHNNLANLLERQRGKELEAVAHYELALPADPNRAEVHFNLAYVLARLPGREAEALEHFKESLRLQPDRAATHYQLANLLARLPGRTVDAQVHYERALELDPKIAGAHKNLANLLTQIPGQQTEALAHFAKALQLDPDYAEAHNDLAALLTALSGSEDDIIAHYEAAVRLKPDFVDARINLASHLARQPGREPEAILHLEQVLRTHPKDAEAHCLLAAVLANQGRIIEAIDHCKQALQIKPDYPAARHTLDQLRALQAL